MFLVLYIYTVASQKEMYTHTKAKSKFILQTFVVYSPDHAVNFVS